MGHEIVNSALGIGVPIMNSMTNTNLNVNQLLNYVKRWKYGLPHECEIKAQRIQ